MAKTHAFRSDEVEPRVGTSYPAAYSAGSAERLKRVLGDRAGLTQFGVNLTVLPPGQASALRHWHKKEDEFVYILDGEVTLVTDDGEELMTAGMCAGFKAGVAKGHHLVNRSARSASFLEVGSRMQGEEVYYPDEDLHAKMRDGRYVFTDKKGEPYG